MDKEKYTLTDVETSLNYGKPLTKTQRRVGMACINTFYVCLALLVVLFVVLCIVIDEADKKELWVFAPIFVIFVPMIPLLRWVLRKRNEREKQIDDCFADAIETRGSVRYQSYVFNDGSQAFTYVVYFSYNGIDYAVAPKKPFNKMLDGDRKDLAPFVGNTCRILYSPKHNDVLILGVKQGEEIK